MAVDVQACSSAERDMPSADTFASACVGSSLSVLMVTSASLVAAWLVPVPSWGSCLLWHSSISVSAMVSVLDCPEVAIAETNLVEIAMELRTAVKDPVLARPVSSRGHTSDRSRSARVDDKSGKTERSVCAIVCTVCTSMES